ncbi:hypothetical protein ACFSCZ_04985 [Siminovitchia sediminis]|uniref:Uncharacterized protein n=1 Tax=Siminovitchia sediminis TaxID=1274353 RepID=A0ABW4KE73_9BACI
MGIHDLVMAMMLLSVWGAATTVSPVSPVTTAVSSLIQANVFTVILRWNLVYAATFLIVHFGVIYAIHMLWFR